MFFFVTLIFDATKLSAQDWFNKWISHNSEKGKFLNKILTPFVTTRLSRWPELGFAICDPLAMAVALYPELVTNSAHKKCVVEKAGVHCRGRTCLFFLEFAYFVQFFF